MSRLDKTIANVGYILDTLMAYRNIVESGCCNNCINAKSCKYLPELGQLVRYNCPFYERKEDNRIRFTFNMPDEVKAAEKFRMDNPEATDDMLKSVPTTQPEIIRCRDCKYFDIGKCGYWNYGVEPFEWCCHAERRTDD